MVERLLNAGADPDAAQTSGLTPLMTAVETGNVEVVRLLLARGADVNAATVATNNTALMWAVAGRHTDIVHRLIEHGADLDVSTAKGFTLLMIAARNGDIEMARTLLAAGVDINAAGADGAHVLPYAIVIGQAEFARFLLEAGADPNARVSGVTALHAATGHMMFWLAEWSQKHGAASRGRGLAESERIPLVEALLARGADPNARITSSAVFEEYLGYPRRGAFDTYTSGVGDLRGATPLWIASLGANGKPIFGIAIPTGCGGAGCQGGEESVPVMRLLLARRGPDADYRRRHDAAHGGGRSRSLYERQEPAAWNTVGSEEAVTLLLDAGAAVNARNEADFTALHGAAFRGLNEVIRTCWTGAPT